MNEIIDFESYLSRIPDLHSWDGGATWNSGGFDPSHLRAFHQLVRLCGGDNAVILETGAGNSTLTFLFASPKRLISIAPEASLFERILRFCDDHQITTSALDYRVERSEWALPELARGGLEIDLALLDGGHGWPTVFVDFCYANAMLRRGGFLVIDDVQLHSVKELGRLLVNISTKFALARDLGKCLVYEKLTSERFLPDWTSLPYIVDQSNLYAHSSSPFALFPGQTSMIANQDVVNQGMDRSAESPSVITAAICTYNRHQFLTEAVGAILRQTLSRELFEIIVVDNSTDREAAETFYNNAGFDPRVRVVWSGPPGLARARNQAIATCETPYIAFFDDDARPDPGWLAALVEGFQRDSRTAAVGGPIRPIWTKEHPTWLPDEYLGLLTIHEPADVDTDLGPGMYLYGTNMAFEVDSLRQVGGFPEQLGRKGGGSLLSNEELQVQDAIRARGQVVRYMKSAAVRHHVHEDRLRRNWLRSRIAWQAVSDHLIEPVQFPHDSMMGELRKLAAGNPDIAAAARLLMSPASGKDLSVQLSTIHHLVSLMLGAHGIDDSQVAALSKALSEFTEAQVQTVPRGPQYLPITDAYAPSSAGAAEARYLFVEGIPGHQYLYDLFGDLPQSHLVTYPSCDAWSGDPGSIAEFKQHLAYIYRSIGPNTKAVIFLTLDQALSTPQREELLRFIAAAPIPVHGILHRLPQTAADIETVRRLGRLMASICFLSETMAEQARSVLNLSRACYVPHHPTTYAYECSSSRRTTLRTKLGVSSDRVVFSIIGEARHGKGIDLLMNALPHIPTAARSKMFILMAGKATHYEADDLRMRLMLARTAGAIDLRNNDDALQYIVLTDREYADYISISDVGLLLYQHDQRYCMSGVLGDYVWARRPVIATDGSYTGSEVHRNGLGLLLRSETPEALAVLLVEALRMVQNDREPAVDAHTYRERIAPESVLLKLRELLEAGGVSRIAEIA